ncbi:unnamed protein product [Bursaphelenchus xylophilus]|uniref:(pine wood nematode) hypothetical protein n=1 Tax=Bursaphelenchus xylophilus TaxID=6326 RepID=A0A1I7S2K7_BURXY|nr:unnamed protein product [Bursaphelenchus xylophilus]CAG9121883.1 unnamed protein product [Bursaphelenchus xylophilus]
MSSIQIFLFITAVMIAIADSKIYNIKGCIVRDDVIHECDGTFTPITEEHEAALKAYMDDLAAYYRFIYPTQPNVRPAPYPTYPKLCKTCDDPTF